MGKKFYAILAVSLVWSVTVFAGQDVDLDSYFSDPTPDTPAEVKPAPAKAKTKSVKMYGENTAQIKARKLPEVKTSDVDLIVPSFVIHGMQPSSYEAAQMPRKIVGNGDAVTTPGVGFEFHDAAGYSIMAVGLKDCFDDLAGALLVGRDYPLGRYTTWGWNVGVYARQTPIACSSPTGTLANGGCWQVDDLPWKAQTTVNGSSVDVIPLPFLKFATALYKDQHVQVNLVVMANFFLNEVGISVPL